MEWKMYVSRTILFMMCNLWLYGIGMAQNNCSNAAPFCAGASGVNFPAGQNTVAAAGPAYGCLSQQRNPAWYYMQAASTGNIIIDISGTGGRDVDFIVWGPFSSPTGNCGSLTTSNILDCSYSTSAYETADIPAIAGQFYMLLITNHSNQAQNINFGLNPSSSATTNCDIFSAVSSKTTCPGAVATISVSTHLGNPSYTWTPGGYSTQTINVSPAATTVYSVTIAGTNTISGTYTTVVSSGTVSVAGLPSVSLTNSGPYCSGSTAVLTATSNGVPHYTWTAASGSSSITTTSVFPIPNIQSVGSNVYSVTVSNTFGCTNTATTALDVLPILTIAVTPTITVCQADSLFLTADAPGAGVYNWTGPAGYSAQGVQNPVVSNAMPNQSGTYTVTVGFGTSTTTCSSNTTIVTVIPPVAIDPLPIQPICNKEDLHLIGPQGAHTYTWTGPANFSSNLDNPSIHHVTAANAGIYSIRATSALGCVDSGTVNVMVYDSLSITDISNNKTICNKNQTVLSGAGLGGSGVYDYAWSPVTGLTNPSDSTTAASPPGTETYTLTLSDLNCPLMTASAVVTVSVLPLPLIAIESKLNEGCAPFITDLQGSSVPASANCLWKFTGGLTASGCIVQDMEFPIAGVYDAMLTVTDLNGCTDSLSKSAFIKVNPRPKADFSWSPDQLSIITNEARFTDHSSIGLPMQSWKWNFKDLDSNVSFQQNPLRLFPEVGNYDVSLSITNVFGCVDSIMKKLIVEDEFAIYIPNSFSPSKKDGINDLFVPVGMGLIDESFEMYIFDRWGNEIYYTNDMSKGWDGTVKNVIAPQDVYVYKITVKDLKMKTKKFTGHITLI